ncbi:porin family protein [Mangrovivirga cuniculi]|uniref:Outer membrane protein beta-barrel domain-containing protein n=1 Tax=Mangrovivirga cuniculi TaxID=2715131 RepID=A0A4D7JJ23_9BACT|nr:porin family protein [Mangrovivirga cuniculi]QCK15979.1 hypothetical protein DCC35_15140 [Mangrovivirga cuniculi]
MQPKKLIFLLTILALPNLLNAQELGIRAGGNLSTWNISFPLEEEETKKYLFGFHIGGTALYELSDNLKLNTGLYFTQKGVVAEYNDIDETSETRLKVNYLQLQGALEYSFGEQNVKPFIQAGPYFSYGISGKAEETFEGTTIESDLDLGNSEDDDFDPIDFGLNFGAGVDIDKFRVGVNYELGLTDLEPNDLDSEDTYKNSSFNLNVSYFFNR